MLIRLAPDSSSTSQLLATTRRELGLRWMAVSAVGQLVVAWVFDLTRDGIKRTAPAGNGATGLSSVAVGLLFVVALLIWMVTAPFDRRLIDTKLLTGEEKAWVDAYHKRVMAEVGPELDAVQVVGEVPAFPELQCDAGVVAVEVAALVMARWPVASHRLQCVELLELLGVEGAQLLRAHPPGAPVVVGLEGAQPHHRVERSPLDPQLV